MATVLGGSQQRESVSPTLNIVQEDVGLPQGEVIPDDSRELTQSWVQVGYLSMYHTCLDYTIHIDLTNQKSCIEIPIKMVYIYVR